MAEIRNARLDDLDAVVGLLERRSREVLGVSEVQKQHVRHDWELPGAEPGFVAMSGGEIVGHAILDEMQHLTVVFTDDGVGDALLARVLDRAREHGFDHVEVTVVDEDVSLRALVERSGFELNREFVRMWKTLGGDLPAARWPADVEVRTYADADGERVHALLDREYAGWDHTYVARGHSSWLAYMTEHDEFDPSMWFLVEQHGELVGCALHWRAQQRTGWVKDIVVAESERGRGIAKALLRHGFRTYADLGAERVGLKVDTTNPTGAPQLYERVGFVVDRRYAIWSLRT